MGSRYVSKIPLEVIGFKPSLPGSRFTVEALGLKRWEFGG